MSFHGPFTSVNDFHVGDRVELHPATDLWMRGARFGSVAKLGRKYLTIELDLLARTVKVAPGNIYKIILTD